MSRHPIAAICVGLTSVVLAGCGGGSKPVVTTKPVDTSSAKTLCPTVLEAQKRYTAATTAMGLQFENKRVVDPAVKSLEELRLRVGQLERVASERQRRLIAPLSVALTNQLLTIRALQQHDVKTAAKYGNSINVPLRRGLAAVRTICAHPA
jgi:hypothetical protein